MTKVVTFNSALSPSFLPLSYHTQRQPTSQRIRQLTVNYETNADAVEDSYFQVGGNMRFVL